MLNSDATNADRQRLQPVFAVGTNRLLDNLMEQLLYKTAVHFVAVGQEFRQFARAVKLDLLTRESPIRVPSRRSACRVRRYGIGPRRRNSPTRSPRD